MNNYGFSVAELLMLLVLQQVAAANLCVDQANEVQSDAHHYMSSPAAASLQD